VRDPKVRLRGLSEIATCQEAKFGVHPHMLRPACGYALANRGMIPGRCRHLGHKNIQHTVRYTELSPTRFKDFWRASGSKTCRSLRATRQSLGVHAQIRLHLDEK